MDKIEKKDKVAKPKKKHTYLDAKKYSRDNNLTLAQAKKVLNIDQ